MEKSVFEVGCGSGANLYFLFKDGFKIGGADYSANLLDVAKKVIGEENFVECFCCDAADIPVDIKYDAVFSSEMFQYLFSLEHAENVLNRMLAKTKKSIGVTSIYREEKKEEYLKFRRETTENYDELYKGLPKLFISENFLKKYAEKNNLDIKFDRYHIKDYWNEPFLFDCFLYKK